jgi:phosphoglycolate phosphatase-like HAD superfamily hydrolase
MNALWKAVLLFDIDGTLIRCGGAGGRALEAALQMEFGVPKVQSVALHGRTDFGIMNELLVLHGLAASEQNRKQLMQRYFSLLPDHLRCSQVDKQACRLPGVVELLDRLSELDEMVTGLMTGNLPASAKIKLGHFQLWDYFQVGIYGDQVDHRPMMAVAASQTLATECGISAADHRVVVIGDTPLDIQLAQSMGARCLAVCTGGYTADELIESGADRVVDDLSATEELLDWFCQKCL